MIPGPPEWVGLNRGPGKRDGLGELDNLLGDFRVGHSPHHAPGDRPPERTPGDLFGLAYARVLFAVVGGHLILGFRRAAPWPETIAFSEKPMAESGYSQRSDRGIAVSSQTG